MSGFLDYPLVPDWYKNGGGIHIKPSKRGTFTKAAKRRGLTVKEFADRVLSNKGKYSSAMVKKANFARNFGGHKHSDGGPIDYSGIVTTNNRPYNVDYIAYIDKALRKGGMNPMQRASVLANIIEESGGDPFAEGPGGFYGLVQWSGDRYKKTGEKDAYKEIDNQVKTILETAGNSTDRISWTHGGKGSGYNSLKDAMDAYNGDDLAGVMRGYTLGYVRPAGGISSYNNRLKVAEQIYGLDGFGNFDAGGLIDKYGEKRVKAALDRLYADGGPLESLVSRVNTTSNADFVRRLKDPKRAVLYNPDGTVSTHELGYVTEGDHAVVFPGIQNTGNGLMRYSYPESYQRAVKNRDTVQMPVPLAERFTREYKDYYPGFDKYADGGHLFEDGGDEGTPIWRYVGKDRSVWSPEEISQIQAQAIQNPGWFWSDDGSQLRQNMYNAGLNNVIETIYNETPDNMKSSIADSALPTSVRAANYASNVTDTMDKAGRTAAIVGAGVAAAPWMLNGAVGTGLWAATNPMAVGQFSTSMLTGSLIDKSIGRFTPYKNFGDYAYTTSGAKTLVDKVLPNKYQGAANTIGEGVFGMMNPGYFTGGLYSKAASGMADLADGASSYLDNAGRRAAEVIVRMGDDAETMKAIGKQVFNKDALSYIFNPNADKSLVYRLPFRYSGNSTTFSEAHPGDIIDQYFGKAPVPDATYDLSVLPGPMRRYVEANYSGRQIPIRNLGNAKSHSIFENASDIKRIAKLKEGEKLLIGKSSPEVYYDTSKPIVDPGGYQSYVTRDGGFVNYDNWDIWKFNSKDYAKRYLSPTQFVQKAGLKFLDKKGTPIIHHWTEREIL